MSDLTETVRAALAKATPGPWEYVESDGRNGADPSIDSATDLIVQPFFGAEADAHLIANAPAWLAELCNRLESAEAEIERLRCLVEAEDMHAALAPGETCDVCAHLEAEGLAEQLEAEMDRADAAEGKLAEVKRIHGWMERYEGGRRLGSFCTDCGTTYPCDTRRAAEGVQP